MTKTSNAYVQMTDEKLIQLIQAGHQRAFTALVERHERLLRFVVRRYLNDPEAISEVVQDTFMRAFRALPGFRGESKFSTWLSRIAVSIAINRLRVRRYEAWDSLDNAARHLQKTTGDSSQVLEKQENSQLLQQALRRLNPQDATALDLFYFREQSIEEIGQITGWTSSNIKSRLSRARQRLHHVLVSDSLYAEHYS